MLALTSFFAGLRTRTSREDGQALVEYTLILGLVTVVAIAALSALGDSVIALLQAVTSALNTVI